MARSTSERLIERTFGRIRRAWRDTGRAGTTSPRSQLQLDPDLPEASLALLREQIDACLKATGGEVSARARAADLGRAYLGLNAAGRERFLRLLAREFGPDRGAIDAAIEEWRRATDDVGFQRAEARLAQALVAPRRRLLTQFNDLPDGVKFLVDLRAELLSLAAADATLEALDRDLKALLAWWFDAGFLSLRRMTWDAPAALLEKLMRYEAVHEIRSWADLKNRLDSDRRCFAFFHPGMPDEPLIFVEVALVEGMAADVHTLLDAGAPAVDPESADTAIFYSISNAQRGLAGVSFGSFLIERVVDDLAHAFPAIKTFATLSPLPGFRSWLDGRIRGGDSDLVKAADAKALVALSGEENASRALAVLLDRPAWHDDATLAEALRGPLLRLGAQYLLGAKAAATGSGAREALDRVARFHLSNGARIERLNWLADTSPSGLLQSAAMMVNYRYRLGAIEANHEAYRGAGRIVATAPVRALARG